MADFEKFDLTKNVPITYGNSTGVAAPAGDEPMRKAFEAYFSDEGQSPKAIEKTFDDQYRLAQAASAWRTWQACWPIAQVSPRATADVERDGAITLLRELLNMRDIAETYASGAMVSDEFQDFRDRVDNFLGTTKPGA